MYNFVINKGNQVNAQNLIFDDFYVCVLFEDKYTYKIIDSQIRADVMRIHKDTIVWLYNSSIQLNTLEIEGSLVLIDNSTLKVRNLESGLLYGQAGLIVNDKNSNVLVHKIKDNFFEIIESDLPEDYLKI